MYTWLIEQRNADSDYSNLASVLTERGGIIKTFPGIFAFNKHDQLTENPFVFQGTISAALMLKNHPKCIIPFTPSNYSCTAYYPHLYPYLLNHDYRLFQMSQITRGDADHYLSELNGEVFVRPVTGLKTFSGQVLDQDELRDLNQRSTSTDPTDLILLAPTHTILREWRLLYRILINDGKYTAKFITGSQYQDHGKHIEEETLANDPAVVWATRALNNAQFFPDPLFYIDIVETDKLGLAVNEFSAFMCGGLYRCNPALVIDEINSIDWM